jgi:hypothetical protein
MGEPITIKRKKKLTIKSRNTAAAAATTAPEGGDASAAPAAAGAPAPASGGSELVLPGLTPGGAAPSVKAAPSYTLYAILAILVTLMFIGIVVIQSMEYSFLLPAFPRPIPAAGM